MEAYQKLEQQFGKWVNNPNTVACTSGTAALHLALETLQTEQQQVIVPEYTMVACARAVSMANLRPIFADCNNSLLIHSDSIRYKITKRTKAVMPVHVYGRRCDMDAIVGTANQHGIKVIEDMAEAHGVPIHPGSYAAAYSFYKNKIIAGEEGGMVVFKNREDAELARSLRSHGFYPKHDFLHRPRGVNARLSNVHAELIIRSLHRVNRNLERRSATVELYNKLIPRQFYMPPRDVCWVYDLRIPGISERQMDQLINSLNRSGVRARHGFKPMSRQEEYFSGGWKSLTAHQVGKEVFYLPVDPAMTPDEVQDICLLVMKALESMRLKKTPQAIHAED